MNDIGKELYERVRADFERRLKSDKRPPKDMRGVSDYSARVGRYLAEAIAANVTEDALPDRRLYYNIAESILEPSLRTNYELVNDTAAEVQRLLDKRQGLHIKPARADYPTERVHAVIGAASEEGIDFDRALRRMTSPAENITQSFADDFMQANAEQRSKAGFDTFIERQGGLSCCPWCAGLVGVFAYPKGLPKEVFARHDNCTCSVTYGTKGGARQNAWTKAKWEVPPIEEPHRMTVEEAAEKGGFAQPRRLGEKLSRQSENHAEPTLTSAKPTLHSEKDYINIEAYARERGIRIYDIGRFDGDTELLKEQIDAIDEARKEFEITNHRIAIRFGLLDDPNQDLAETNKRGDCIEFNYFALRDRKATETFMNSDNSLAATKAAGIAFHEMGHVISIKRGEIGLDIATKAYYNIFKKEPSRSELLEYLGTNISKYSTSVRSTAKRPYSAKDYKEVTPEIYSKHKTDANEFTKEFVKLLKEEYFL